MSKEDDDDNVSEDVTNYAEQIAEEEKEGNLIVDDVEGHKDTTSKNVSKDVSDIVGVTEKADVTTNKDVTNVNNNNNKNIFDDSTPIVARYQNNMEKNVNDLPEGPIDS